MADIQIKGLSYQRADFLLQLDSLAIQPGEKVALMGENGCGKSTLIHLMTGLIDAATDSVFYQKSCLQDIAHSQRARLFSVLPQFADISFPFSVFDVALLGRFAHLTDADFSQSDRDKTDALLQQLDLAHYRDRSFAELSGGEKRRVMIARVLNQQAPIIYLDEPNASLDIRHTLQLFEHLEQLPETVISSVHDINLAHRYFDRFLFFKQGQLLFDVSKAEVSSPLLSEVYDVSVSIDTDSFRFCP